MDTLAERHLFRCYHHERGGLLFFFWSKRRREKDSIYLLRPLALKISKHFNPSFRRAASWVLDLDKEPKEKKREIIKKGHLSVVSVLLYISRMDVTLWFPFSGIIAYTEYLFLLCILTSEYDLYLSIFYSLSVCLQLFLSCALFFSAPLFWNHASYCKHESKIVLVRECFFLFMVGQTQRRPTQKFKPQQKRFANAMLYELHIWQSFRLFFYVRQRFCWTEVALLNEL